MDSILVCFLFPRLGYTTASDVIELKGHVACELSRLVKNLTFQPMCESSLQVEDMVQENCLYIILSQISRSVASPGRAPCLVFLSHATFTTTLVQLYSENISVQ